jgi:NAD/NADP transhydrogenase alpha subunit
VRNPAEAATATALILLCTHRAVDTPEFAAALVNKGYTQLVIQKGAGEYSPARLVQAGSTTAELPSGLNVQ